MNISLNGEGKSHKENNNEPTAHANGTVRYHYMDNLRALAMLVGIVFHAALAYTPMMQEIWLSASNDTSNVIDFFAWFSHIFRMPVFFVISGYFAIMLIEKRGHTNFIIHRTKRILAPFLLFLPLIIISFIIIVGYAMESVENPSPMLKLIMDSIQKNDGEKPPLSTAHLWFLFNLYLFCFALFILSKAKVLTALFNRVTANINILLFIFPLLLVPSLLSQSVPFPAPEKFYPELWSFGFYGLLFLLGALIYQHQEILEKTTKYAPYLLVMSVIFYLIVYYFMPKKITLEEAIAIGQGVYERALTWQHLATCILTAYISVFMVFVCLTIARRFLDKKNATFETMSRASYWIYIIHLPILFYLQFLLLDVHWNLWVEFTISTFGTLLIGIISYQLFVKWSPIGWLLNGKKEKSKTNYLNV